MSFVESRLEFASLRQLQDALRSRRIGAVELLDHQLARIAAQNRSINAVVALDPEAARRAAQRADQALAAGERAPLLGIPMTVKDSFAAAGLPASGGIPGLKDYRAPDDAEAVALLRQAGAVIFGKTNVPFACSDHQTYNDLYGLTRNPWNGERTVGGSSGGSAAALAAGFTPVELGSDIGGSIRVPAHCCGVFGHKPSFGLVSGRGHIPPMPGVLSRPELSVAGPMARSAHDLEILLDIVAGPDAARRGAWKVELPAPRHRRLEEFRVALWVDDPLYPVDGKMRAEIEAFADDLAGLGVRIDRHARPEIGSDALFETYFAVLMGIIGARLPAEEREAIAAAGAAASAGSYAKRLADAVSQPLPTWFARAEEREHIFLAWRRFFETYDLVVCPAFGTVAFPHDTAGHGIRPQLSRTIAIDGAQRPYLDNLMWPGVATVSNLPATAMPTGRFVDGLPVGVQILGPYLEDLTPLRFAQLVEDRLSPFRIPPCETATSST